MKIIERIFQFFEYQSIKPSVSEKELGIGNGTFGKALSRSGGIGSEIIEKFVEKYNINPDWLITGNGEMLNSNIPNNMDCNKCTFRNDVIRYQRDLVRYQKEIEYLNKQLDVLRHPETPESKLKNAS